MWSIITLIISNWLQRSILIQCVGRIGQMHEFQEVDDGTPLQYSCLEIPWTEEPGRLQSMGSLRIRHDWETSLSLFTFTHWRRKWQPTPLFLLGVPGMAEPGGLPSRLKPLSSSSLGSRRMGGVIYFTLFPLACKASLLYLLTTKSLAPRTCDSRWLTCEVEYEGSGGRMKRAWHEEGWVRKRSCLRRHF